MNRALFLMAGLLTVAGVASPPTSATSAPTDAVFVDSTGVYFADYAWTGECSGAISITLTIFRPGGTDVRVKDVAGTMVPDVCFPPPSCMDCPPVPLPFAWELKGPGVALVGGGSAYYDHYQNNQGAWSLQGPFDEGHLEARGVLWL